MMCRSRQSIALVLTTKNNQTQHYIHQKHKRETEKTALAIKTIYTLIWYGFLLPPVRKRSGPYSYIPRAHTGHEIRTSEASVLKNRFYQSCVCPYLNLCLHLQRMSSSLCHVASHVGSCVGGQVNPCDPPAYTGHT